MADYKKAKDAALSILREFEVTAPPVNPVEICRNKGINVHFVKFQPAYANISGFYDCVDDSISINEEEYPLRQTFTIAHELGHRILHKEWAESNNYEMMMRGHPESNNCYEQEANEFAGQLLVPRFLLDPYVDQLTKTDLSKLFAVSVPTISVRLSKEYGI